MDELKGYFAALPTPFDSGGHKIAEKPLCDLVERNIESGLDGLYVCGSTGESFLMSVAERETVFRYVTEAADKRTVLIAQIGDPNPAVSARLAKTAATLGYDAISALPPFYYGYNIAEITRHYSWLAGQTDLPLVIYNIPHLSGVKWSVKELVQILELPGIIGVKNTSNDLYAFEQLRRMSPDSILLHGFDETLLSGLAMGADGGIGSTYNLQATRIKAIAKAHSEGRNDDAITLQAAANTLIDAMVSVGVLPSLKFMLSLRGIEMGDCRPPFSALQDDQKKMLEEIAEKFV